MVVGKKRNTKKWMRVFVAWIFAPRRRRPGGGERYGTYRSWRSGAASEKDDTHAQDDASHTAKERDPKAKTRLQPHPNNQHANLAMPMLINAALRLGPAVVW